MALVACCGRRRRRRRAGPPGRLARRGDRLQAALRGPLSRSLLAGPADRGLRPRARAARSGRWRRRPSRERARTGSRSSGSTTAAAVRRAARSPAIRSPDHVEPAHHRLHLRPRSPPLRRSRRGSTTGSTARRSAGSGSPARSERPRSPPTRTRRCSIRPTRRWSRSRRCSAATTAHFRAGEEPPWRGIEIESLWETLSRSPGCLVGLHYADARRPARSRSQRAAERAEGLSVLSLTRNLFSSALRSASALKSRREPSAKATASRPSKSTGAGSRGASPSTQIARSLRSGGSLTPSTRFQATARPSAAVPTPADQLQTVWRGW